MGCSKKLWPRKQKVQHNMSEACNTRCIHLSSQNSQSSRKSSLNRTKKKLERSTLWASKQSWGYIRWLACTRWLESRQLSGCKRWLENTLSLANTRSSVRTLSSACRSECTLLSACTRSARTHTSSLAACSKSLPLSSSLSSLLLCSRSLSSDVCPNLYLFHLQIPSQNLLRFRSQRTQKDQSGKFQLDR